MGLALTSATHISESPEDIIVDDQRPRESVDQDVKIERRRAGRVDYSNPALIRMMRGTYEAAVHELVVRELPDLVSGGDRAR